MPELSTTSTSGPSGIAPRLAGHYVLAACKRAGIPDVGPMKLLKLVYIAHGYHLAINGSPLLAVPAEAWKYGPIIRDLYLAVRRYGCKIVPLDLLSEHVPVDGQDHSSYREVIADVVAAYGRYEGLTLAAATHQQGTPWSETRASHGANAVIDDNLLRSYYEKLTVPEGA